MDIKLELIFFSGILFGQIIGILLGPKIYRMVHSKIESYRNRKTTPQTQIIVDPFYVETATRKYFFRSDLIKKYGRKGLFHLIAEGIFEHELAYEKRNLS